MNWLTRHFRKKEEVVDPEVALIMQELDDELSQEHELLDGVGLTSRNVGDLLRSFAQRCQKIALVGSCRRGKESPQDVDVLYIPKSNLQVMAFLEQVADDEQLITKKDQAWTCSINGLSVDFIESTSEFWGRDMLFFTGSREFNERILRHAKRRGYGIQDQRPTSRFNGGYSSWTGPAFQGWSEEKILSHLGLGEFVNPRKREVGQNPSLLVVQ